jgi:hypothetical protein
VRKLGQITGSWRELLMLPAVCVTVARAQQIYASTGCGSNFLLALATGQRPAAHKRRDPWQCREMLFQGT